MLALAAAVGRVRSGEPLLARVHSSCVTSEAYGRLRLRHGAAGRAAVREALRTLRQSGAIVRTILAADEFGALVLGSEIGHDRRPVLDVTHFERFGVTRS